MLSMSHKNNKRLHCISKLNRQKNIVDLAVKWTKQPANFVFLFDKISLIRCESINKHPEQ